MEARPEKSLSSATRTLVAAKNAYNAARALVDSADENLSLSDYSRIMGELGDTHRALQRARYAYKAAGGF